MKKIIVFSILFFLTWCWTTNKVDTQNIKLWNIQFNINKNFLLTDIKNNDDKINILYSYKLYNNKRFSISIIIWKYKWNYPKDKNEFINIIVDKIQKNVAGSNIININEFKKWNIIIKSIAYKVSDNLFDEKKWNIYYAIQYYIFSKNNIYVISYISWNKDSLDKFKKNIENLQLIK